MTNYARIIDGVAVDVSGDPVNSFHPDLVGDFVEVHADVQPGWRLVGDGWVAPEPAPVPQPAPVLAWANAPAEYWWIERGPFYDRFGSKAILITRSQDATVQGMLKLVEPRQYVDLKRADVIQSVNALSALVTGITQADVQSVLNTPTTDDERYIKGLAQPV